MEGVTQPFSESLTFSLQRNKQLSLTHSGAESAEENSAAAKQINTNIYVCALPVHKDLEGPQVQKPLWVPAALCGMASAAQPVWPASSGLLLGIPAAFLPLWPPSWLQTSEGW